MLVLSRQRNEEIVIQTASGIISVSVVEIRRNGYVRLGIDAPREIRVDRREIYESKQQGKNSNSKESGNGLSQSH